MYTKSALRAPYALHSFQTGRAFYNKYPYTSFMHKIAKFAPLIFAVIILAVVILLAPWDKVLPLLRTVHTDSFLLLAALAAVYYAAKAFRFWAMLRLLDVHRPLGRVSLIYLSAQPMSVLPAGELFRSILLEREENVPVRTSASTVTLQGLIEAMVLVGFSMAGALALGTDRLAVVGAALLVVTLIVALKQGWLKGGDKWLNRLPWVNISRRKYNQFLKDHQALLSGNALFIVGGLSLIPVLCGIGILLVSAQAVGAHLTFAGASIGYSLPVVLSGLSFLPGGIGASEGGSIGVLKLLEVSTAGAFAVTLLVRVFTLGAGMIFGLVGLVILNIMRHNK